MTAFIESNATSTISHSISSQNTPKKSSKTVLNASRWNGYGITLGKGFAKAAIITLATLALFAGKATAHFMQEPANDVHYIKEGNWLGSCWEKYYYTEYICYESSGILACGTKIVWDYILK